jgi:ribosomal protein S18 acetylase RimI-like enzyme
MNSQAKNMTIGSVRITPMTEASLDSVVEVHLAAFPDYMNTQLGRGYLHAFLRGFLQREDTVALLALRESGQVLGYAAGAPVQSSPEMNRALVPAAILAVLSKPWILGTPRIRRTAWQRIRSIFGAREAAKPTPLLPMPTLSLVSIAVDPQARGRSVGEQLIKAIERVAKERGCAALRLSVYPQNAGARRFYEKNDWVPFQESVPEGHAMYYSKIF